MDISKIIKREVSIQSLFACGYIFGSLLILAIPGITLLTLIDEGIKPAISFLNSLGYGGLCMITICAIVFFISGWQFRKNSIKIDEFHQLLSDWGFKVIKREGLSFVAKKNGIYFDGWFWTSPFEMKPDTFPNLRIYFLGNSPAKIYHKIKKENGKITIGLAYSRGSIGFFKKILNLKAPKSIEKQETERFTQEVILPIVKGLSYLDIWKIETVNNVVVIEFPPSFLAHKNCILHHIPNVITLAERLKEKLFSPELIEEEKRLERLLADEIRLYFADKTLPPGWVKSSKIKLFKRRLG